MANRSNYLNYRRQTGCQRGNTYFGACKNMCTYDYFSEYEWLTLTLPCTACAYCLVLTYANNILKVLPSMIFCVEVRL